MSMHERDCFTHFSLQVINESFRFVHLHLKLFRLFTVKRLSRVRVRNWLSILALDFAYLFFKERKNSINLISKFKYYCIF